MPAAWGHPAVSGMHIVIVGGGEIGLGLSRALAPRHEVVLVDHVAAIAERFAALDVQVIVGNGTNPDVLRQAGVPTCDVLVAATGMDEVNVLAALIANRLGSPTTICLASRDDLLQPLGGRDLLREHVGIDRVVWPEAQLAENIERIVTVPGALDAETFAQGRVALLEYRLDPGSRLLGTPLSGVPLPRGVLIVAVRRHDRVVIPDGATRLEAGDKVFVMGLTAAVGDVRSMFHRTRTPARQHVTIVGGGDVGMLLAQRLEARDDVDICVIERNAARGEAIAARLRRALVLNGDGTDVELLQAEDIGRSDVLVAVVDCDERNLLASLLARQLGVRRVVARVTRPANLRLFERMGVDVALSARGAAIAAIAHHIEGGPWSLLAVLEDGQAQVIEVQVPAGYPPTPLRTIGGLRGTIVGAVLRDDTVVVPGGDETIRGGDRLLVVTANPDAEALRRQFSPPS
jgi:trk system potassium uptake protein